MAGKSRLCSHGRCAALAYGSKLQSALLGPGELCSVAVLSLSGCYTKNEGMALIICPCLQPRRTPSSSRLLWWAPMMRMTSSWTLSRY